MEPDKILSQAKHELKCGCYERGLYYADQGIVALIDLEDMYNPKAGKEKVLKRWNFQTSN